MGSGGKSRFTGRIPKLTVRGEVKRRHPGRGGMARPPAARVTDRVRKRRRPLQSFAANTEPASCIRSPAPPCRRHRPTRPVRSPSALAALAQDAATKAEEAGGRSCRGRSRQAARPEGILHIPNYTGDIWQRGRPAGDLGGARTKLAQHGHPVVGVDWTNTFQSVVERRPRRGHRARVPSDYNLALDLMRMGLVPGGLIRMRGESRYGDSVNGDTGQLLPASTDQFFPLAGELDEGIPFYLTTLSYTQFFSESFGLVVGKFDTLDGDGQRVRRGARQSQFMNLNFVLGSPSPIIHRAVRDTRWTGLIVEAGDTQLLLSTSLFTTSDRALRHSRLRRSATTGLTWIGTPRSSTTSATLPGGVHPQRGLCLRQRLRHRVGRRNSSSSPARHRRRVHAARHGRWAAYLSAWQYVLSEEHAGAAANTRSTPRGTAGPDPQGSRACFTRLAPSPTRTANRWPSSRQALGSAGAVPSRPRQRTCTAWRGTSTTTSRPRSPELARHRGGPRAGRRGLLQLAITPAAALTFDVQVLEPLATRYDPAVLLGMRLRLQF